MLIEMDRGGGIKMPHNNYYFKQLCLAVTGGGVDWGGEVGGEGETRSTKQDGMEE